MVDAAEVIDVAEAVIEEVAETAKDVEIVMAVTDVETEETIGKFFYLTKFLLIF